MNIYDDKKQQVQAAQGQSAPAAQNPEDWNRQLSSIMDKINNREPFSFDLNGDALYQQYKDQYQKLGRAAMQDTVGQASGLTGGYGSTYAENAGQQAYNAYLDRLNSIVPDIYAQQRSAYDAQNSELYNQFSLAQQMYGNARTAQADADSKILTLLQMGVQPSAADVAASGYSQDEIDKMYQYYKTAAAKAGSGGVSSKKATTGKVPADEYSFNEEELNNLYSDYQDGNVSESELEDYVKDYANENGLSEDEVWQMLVESGTESGNSSGVGGGGWHAPSPINIDIPK